MKYLLDTHTWIWWHTAPEKLPEQIHKIIESPESGDSILLSSISIWEFCKLVEKSRITLSLDSQDWIDKALDMAGLFLVPLTPEISYRSTTLPGDFHKDPGDQILAATARTFNALLLTKDQKLHSYPHVRTLWGPVG